MPTLTSTMFALTALALAAFVAAPGLLTLAGAVAGLAATLAACRLEAEAE
jgi:hypothetical protein